MPSAGCKTIIYLSLLLLNYCVFSQTPLPTRTPQLATAEDGRKVILKADGTWSFQTETLPANADVRPTKTSNSSLSAYTEYDRFTDTSTVTRSLDSIKLGNLTPFDVMEVEIKAVFQGKEPKIIKKFSMLLTVMNARKGQRIADADSAFLLIKDSRFEIPFEYPQTESNFLVVEIPVDRPVRKVLYEADKGELKVGTIVIHLSNAQLEGIRSVIDGLPPLASEMKSRNKDVTASVQSFPQRTIKKVASPLEVESDRFGFIDTPVQVTCLIGLSDNYWDEYREARTTHFAFQVWNLNGKLSGYFYMVRGEKAEQLRKTILATGITAPKATVTFVIKREKFKSDSPFFTAELVDWIQ